LGDGDVAVLVGGDGGHVNLPGPLMLPYPNVPCSLTPPQSPATPPFAGRLLVPPSRASRMWSSQMRPQSGTSGAGVDSGSGRISVGFQAWVSSGELSGRA
jgi:hypothetical protein